MTLQEQVVSFPLVGGVDESAPKRLCARLLTMQNCRQFKSGALAKRYGTTCVGPYNSRLDGTTPPATELLTSLNSDLVRVGAGQIDTCRVFGLHDCIFKGRASEALVYRKSITNGESYVGDCDVAYANGLVFYVFYSNAGLLLAGTGTVNYMVLTPDGDVVQPRQVLASGASGRVGRAQICAIGNSVIIAWGDLATGIVARVVDATHLTIGSQATLVADTAAIQFSMSGLSDRFALVYASTAGNVNVGTWDAALGVKTAAVAIDTVTTLQASGSAGVVGGQLHVGWGDLNGSLLRVRRAVFTTNTLASVAAAANITSATSSPIAEWAATLGVCMNAAGTGAWYAWTRMPANLVEKTDVNWVDVTNSGTIGGTVYSTWQTYAQSRPFVTNGSLYMLVTGMHSTHRTAFLVQLQDHSTPATTDGMRIVAVMAPRQCPRQANIFSAGVSSNVVSVGGNRWILGAVVSGDLPDAMVAAYVDLRVGATSPVAAQLGGLLVLSGGAVHAYDGSQVAELGMAYEPDTYHMSASATTGSGVGNGTYYYLVTYEWQFANSGVVRSIPSYPANYDATKPIASQGLISATTTTGNNQVDLAIPTLNLTNKQLFNTTIDGVYIVLYRTLAGGATFYRQSAIQIDAASLNNPSTQGISISDTTPDSTLQTMPVLYTTGGALPSEVPPSAAHVAAIQGRIWLSGTDDDTIWISHEVVEGEAPAFSGSVTIAPFEGGRVVACAQLDDKKLIFKTGAVYVTSGTGPGIDGQNGSFAVPERVPTELGCIDARSVVATPQGVFFLSQNGLALVGHDLSVGLVGKAIEDTVGASGVSASALIPDQEVLRVSIAGTAKTVEFDTFHGGAWGVNVYQDPAAPSAVIAAATYAKGAWYYVNDSGHLFVETKTDWRDTNGTSSWVTMRARTRYLSLGDLQGFARIWYASLVGERKTSHDLTVTLYIDDNASFTETSTWTSGVVDAWDRYQAQIHVSQQECEAMSVEFSDATPSAVGASVGTGQGGLLFGVTAEVGLEKPLRRLPTAQSG